MAFHLVEIAWEVCQQLGGIYTVIRSKAPSIVRRLGDRYTLVGPLNRETAALEFEANPSPIHSAVCNALGRDGYEAVTGTWLIPGRPRVILLDLEGARKQLPEIKYFLWEKHSISTSDPDDLTDQVLLFGFMVEKFLMAFLKETPELRSIAHFHEWMAASAIPEIKRKKLRVSTVFTTHATLLGRYLAQSDDKYFEHLPLVNPGEEARKFGIHQRSAIEAAAAQKADVFTTLSDITALECNYLLKRKPDHLTPNGINFERPVALHEFQNLHVTYKERINQFIIGHFFPSYTFDLDKTLYFFSAGRYEYRNKGYDLLIDSLAHLNRKLKAEGTDKTIVAFLVTKRPTHSINPGVLANFAMMEEIRRVCEGIQEQIGERLFYESAMGNKPQLETLVDDYWWLRLRRTMHAWKTRRLPPIITHNVVDDAGDDVLKQLRFLGLFNAAEDPVKIIYHPDFITETNPLFGMDYEQFTRGCHMGIFPSYYEPWGYTPLECVVRGVPSVTSDLAGFGSYVTQNIADLEDHGVYVLPRRGVTFDDASARLGQHLWEYCQLERRDRIVLRNKCESLSDQFDWNILSAHYFTAYEDALSRLSS